MKKISCNYFVPFNLAVTSLVTAQKTTLEYLKTVPGNPDSVCVCLKKVRQNYETAVSELYDIVKEDIQSRTRAVEDYMDQNQDRMKASMMKEMSEKTGMSQQELPRALSKKKNLSKEDKQALMDKVLGQHNLSMGEVQNMKNMDANARKSMGREHMQPNKWRWLREIVKIHK